MHWNTDEQMSNVWIIYHIDTNMLSNTVHQYNILTFQTKKLTWQRILSLWQTQSFRIISHLRSTKYRTKIALTEPWARDLCLFVVCETLVYIIMFQKLICNECNVYHNAKYSLLHKYSTRGSQDPFSEITVFL